VGILFAILLALPANAVAPAAPASCRSVTRSKLGEHLREMVWEITRARTKLTRTLAEHHERCLATRGELTETRQLSQIERLAEEARREQAELLDLEDEYLRTAETASEAAHLLQENDCQDRIVEQRKKLEALMSQTEKEVHDVLSKYCR
jgi:hypothetical protein